MTCNVTSSEVTENNLVYTKFQFKLDQDLATDVATWGGTISGLSALLASATAGVGAVAAGALAAVCLVEAAWIDTAANGCGVTIDIWLVNDAVEPRQVEDIPYHYISSQ